MIGVVTNMFNQSWTSFESWTLKVGKREDSFNNVSISAALTCVRLQPRTGTKCSLFLIKCSFYSHRKTLQASRHSAPRLFNTRRLAGTTPQSHDSGRCQHTLINHYFLTGCCPALKKNLPFSEQKLSCEAGDNQLCSDVSLTKLSGPELPKKNNHSMKSVLRVTRCAICSLEPAGWARRKRAPSHVGVALNIVCISWIKSFDSKCKVQAR